MERPSDYFGQRDRVTVTLTPAEVIALVEDDWAEIEDSNDEEWATLASAQGKLRAALRDGIAGEYRVTITQDEWSCWDWAILTPEGKWLADNGGYMTKELAERFAQEAVEANAHELAPK